MLLGQALGRLVGGLQFLLLLLAVELVDGGLGGGGALRFERLGLGCGRTLQRIWRRRLLRLHSAEGGYLRNSHRDWP